MQVMVQTAAAHGASVDQPLPLNTAFVCWQLARQEQLATVLGMLAAVLGRPRLQSSFSDALTQLGKKSHAATLSTLMEVPHRPTLDAVHA